MKLTTLIYHDVLAATGIDDSGFRGAAAASYKLEESSFRKHLDVVARALDGRHVATLRSKADLLAADGAVCLTFDDGGSSSLGRISDALEERGWRGQFFVISAYIGLEGFMVPTAIRRLHERGHAIGTHSATHPRRMSKLAPAEICAEWRDSAARIADIIGAAVTVGSVPGGYYAPVVALAAAEAGLDVLFTSEPTRRVWSVNNTMIAGRFSVTRRSGTDFVDSIVRGRIATELRSQAAWQAKKVLKLVGGRGWLAARRAAFEVVRQIKK
jgi:peptidoglycan/xylan/chitin deacetylase (PgdA/CDA1 family)